MDWHARSAAVSSGPSPLDNTREFTYLWTKTNRTQKPDELYHPLALHLVDVASVAHETWRSSWSPYRRQRWCDALGVGEDLAGRWLAFIAGAHDVGKSSPVFEQQAPVQMERISRQTGIAFTRRETPIPLPHGLITAGTLGQFLISRFGFSKPDARRLALTTGAHHGRFATAGLVRLVGPDGGNSKQIGDGVWATWRTDLLDYLARAVGLPDTLPEALRRHRLSYDSATELAGAVAFADWIGSDRRSFPFSTIVPDDPAVAFAESSGKARRGLSALGFDRPTVPIPAATISDTFDHVRVPNAGQDTAMQVMEGREGPGIAVVEYPMGWGKTEVALWMAARWAERDGIDGFYVAMPTRTTSDQLYSRVAELLVRHGRAAGVAPQLIKVSGQNPLAVGPDDLQQLIADMEAEAGVFDHADPGSDSDSTGDRSIPDRRSMDERRRAEAYHRARWFGQRGQGILAAYGVGTVDQAMLGVLASRHHFVRLAGLASRTVIFDEVHAYDIYMSAIVDRLLSFLGALGSPVVILTATLPKHRTQALMAAYVRGANLPVLDMELAAYPRLSVATRSGDYASVSVRTPVSDTRPTLQLRRLTQDIDDEEGMWREVSTRLNDALTDGGTAAVICNTVTQAQDAMRALASVFPVEELELFHARFRQRERRTIQERVLRDFGKDTGSAEHPIRPRRRIVVATQVIEQSLDLDFDLMVSMFCPVDLLLQRSGRLQRHRATDDLRPGSLSNPTLWLVGYDERGDDSVPRFARGSQAVYGAFLLLRSWWALGGRESIRIPDDIEELIEAAYNEDDAIPAGAERLGGAWEKARQEFQERQGIDERAAEMEMVPALEADDPAVGNDALTQDRSFSEPADELPPEQARFATQTRLGPPSVTAVILTAAEARKLVPAGPTDGRKKPSARVTAELLERSVSVSLRGVAQAIIGLDPEPAWKDVPALRFARLIQLGDGDACHLSEKWTVRLDHHLGVCFDRVTVTPPTMMEEEE